MLVRDDSLIRHAIQLRRFRGPLVVAVIANVALVLTAPLFLPETPSSPGTAQAAQPPADAAVQPIRGAEDAPQPPAEGHAAGTELAAGANDQTDDTEQHASSPVVASSDVTPVDGSEGEPDDPMAVIPEPMSDDQPVAEVVAGDVFIDATAAEPDGDILYSEDVPADAEYDEKAQRLAAMLASETDTPSPARQSDPPNRDQPSAAPAVPSAAGVGSSAIRLAMVQQRLTEQTSRTLVAGVKRLASRQVTNPPKTVSDATESQTDLAELVDATPVEPGPLGEASNSEPPVTSPPSTLTIANPSETGGPVIYVVDGFVHSLQAGESHALGVQGARVVRFHRGEQFGDAQLELADGMYRFAVTDRGWDLTRADAPDAGDTELSN